MEMQSELKAKEALNNYSNGHKKITAFAKSMSRILQGEATSV